MHIDDDIKERVTTFLNSKRKYMGDALGIEFTSFKKNEVTATMPVNDHTVQPFGILHGGASVALAETLASIGAWIGLKEEGETAVGVEINANHLRPVSEGGRVTGIAKPVHQGKKIQVWETLIYNQEEKLICISRCTLAIVGD